MPVMLPKASSKLQLTDCTSASFARFTRFRRISCSSWKPHPTPRTKSMVTSPRVTPNGLHVSVLLCRLKSGRNCSVSTYLLGRRVIRKSAILEKITWNGACCALYRGFEDIMKQAFRENFMWRTISHLFAGSGAHQHHHHHHHHHLVLDYNITKVL